MVTEDLGEVECGTVAVPENWANPGERTLTISYAVLKALSDHPEPDPVVYLEGGPGGSALGGIAMFADVFAVQRQTRDIVLFDQRGTQFSSPLVCSAFTIDDAIESFTTPAAVEDEPESTPEQWPMDLSPSSDAEGMMAAARVQVGDRTARCVRELLGKGIDLRQYNSIANANDTVALVNALGYETYNLYGISYGTRLALVLMRDHPEGIRSVVLDSTFPPEIHGFELYPKEAEEVEQSRSGLQKRLEGGRGGRAPGLRRLPDRPVVQCSLSEPEGTLHCPDRTASTAADRDGGWPPCDRAGCDRGDAEYCLRHPVCGLHPEDDCRIGSR